MSLQFDDTIAALASAPGPAACGIVRVSGPNVSSIVAPAFVPGDAAAFATSRKASCHRGFFRSPDLRAPVPVRLYYWPTSRTYTGSPMAEIHAPGSPPLLEAILSELHRRGARPARAGEFTLRAFLAGRIDLTQAEAVLGVIDAHDHRELARALDQLAGGISGPIARIREDLLLLLADLEAELDFVEEDIEFVPKNQVVSRLDEAAGSLASLISQAAARMKSTGRLRVVLGGLPNAGKSTLFNALLGNDAALVSDLQGTTRDYLAADLRWNGLSVELVDTAGWHDPDAEIDRQAQRLRCEQFERADLVVWCTAADVSPALRQRDADLRNELAPRAVPTLFVTTKADCLPIGAVPQTGEIPVSARTGDNLEALVQGAVALLSETRAGERQMLGTTASRCRDSLSRCTAALDAARRAADAGCAQEIVAIEIRSALDALGAILGTVYTDDILDRIFSRFCIGK